MRGAEQDHGARPPQPCHRSRISPSRTSPWSPCSRNQPGDLLKTQGDLIVEIAAQSERANRKWRGRPGFGQRTRHPRRHELRQQAERHRRIRTVVSGNLEPGRLLAFVGAVTGKPASPPSGWFGQRSSFASRHACVLTYSAAERSVSWMSCTRPPTARRRPVRAGHFFFAGRSPKE